MITLEMDKTRGIAIMHPKGKLEESDFTNLARQLDKYIEAKGSLSGLIIHAQAFPGWEDFAAFSAHMKFVNEHHKLIKKVALVSDSAVLSIAPKIASHFVSAEVRHFDYANMQDAKTWMEESQQ